MLYLPGLIEITTLRLYYFPQAYLDGKPQMLLLE